MVAVVCVSCRVESILFPDSNPNNRHHSGHNYCISHTQGS